MINMVSFAVHQFHLIIHKSDLATRFSTQAQHIVECVYQLPKSNYVKSVLLRIFNTALCNILTFIFHNYVTIIAHIYQALTFFTQYHVAGIKPTQVIIFHQPINSYQLTMTNFRSCDLFYHNFDLTFASQGRFRKLTFAYNLSLM